MPVSHPRKAPAPRRPTAARSRKSKLSVAGDYAATTLSSGSGLQVQVTAAGAVFALRHGKALINQFLPGPAEDGFFRLLVRRLAGNAILWEPVVGPGIAWRKLGPRSMEWSRPPRGGFSATATLTLHPRKPAWAWSVRVHNTSGQRARFDVLMAQDLGLGDEAAVRRSEAFTSQYIDLLPIDDPQLGWVILARQNQKMEGGHFPWLAAACCDGAASYCTDAVQFFGADHRLTGIPAAALAPSLASARLQYESALVGLQSRRVLLEPDASAGVTFVARFIADHPAASSRADLARVHEVLPATWARAAAPRAAAKPGAPASIFAGAPWLHGDAPKEKEWSAWFPGERRNPEHATDGGLHSFFTGAATHVVARAKEATVARPHGHILRSGKWSWVDPGQFGITCYASGIFSTQAYLGNQSLARLLPVVRDCLGVGRSAGQRVFVRRSGTWHQLGVPSAFAMTPSDARWTYKVGEEVIEARAWCSRAHAASFLELKVGPGGKPLEFLVTHTLALGDNEHDHAGEVRLFAGELWAACTPAPGSAVGGLIPGACFAIAAAEPGAFERIGGDEALYGDGIARGNSCVTLRSAPVRRLGVILCGSLKGPPFLWSEMGGARREWKRAPRPAGPAGSPVSLALGEPRKRKARSRAGDAVARIDEVLPWFAHNAAIHFSAPHGLEQQGGAAWGVRDVCQGSLEWLLAAGEWSLARRALETVFQQQDPHDGSWPQWFMQPPYQFIRQSDSHGDVCFWPVKALCDYVEASNDLKFLRAKAGYVGQAGASPVGPMESLLEHCDRVIGLCESRFVAGTALVNYGDGDWDDTLRPADPRMRTRMVSTWTVALAFHTFRQLAEVCRRLGETARLNRIRALLSGMRRDFAGRLMPGGVVAGFLVTERDGSWRPLLHPDDRVTGIHYRLLPMTRAILAELFTPGEAASHLAIVHSKLLYPDGVRLMSEPATYTGGCERLFLRADTAANVGREIGLQYVHAHLRYAEAMAKIGDADRLWTALQVVNPVGLAESVPNAMPRQSNMYFSSSDADFGDRVEASRRWQELRSGRVGVRGGWRLYSSGPGIFLHKVRACLLGLRESFGEVVIDPVLPMSLDGLVAQATLCGHKVTLTYRVRAGVHSPGAVTVNGVGIRAAVYESNPYRTGGLRIRESELKALLSRGGNTIVIDL